MTDIERPSTKGDGQGDGNHDDKGDKAIRIEFVGVRGGHCTSTVAAATALMIGAAQPGVLLEANDAEATAALLGCAVPNGSPVRLTDSVEFAPLACSMRPGISGVVVSDRGQLGALEVAAEPSHKALRVGVLRGPCYVALRTLVAADTASWAGLVLCAETGRALDRRDVEDITGHTVLATVDVTPAVARTLDAGLAATRLPKMREFSQVRRWITSLGSGPAFGLDRGAPGSVAFRPEPVEITCTDWHLPPKAEGSSEEPWPGRRSFRSQLAIAVGRGPGRCGESHRPARSVGDDHGDENRSAARVRAQRTPRQGHPQRCFSAGPMRRCLNDLGRSDCLDAFADWRSMRVQALGGHRRARILSGVLQSSHTQ